MMRSMSDFFKTIQLEFKLGLSKKRAGFALFSAGLRIDKPFPRGTVGTENRNCSNRSMREP